MAEARKTADWDTAAAIIATTINVNRDPRKGRPVTIQDIHPYHTPAPRGIRLTTETLHELKPIFEKMNG